VVEEREADVRRALEVKDEQLMDALATLQVKEDQVRVLVYAMDMDMDIYMGL
jgi:hypothetical protein